MSVEFVQILLYFNFLLFNKMKI